MMRPSRWLWLVVVGLLLVSGYSALITFGTVVGAGRSHPIYMDELSPTLTALHDAGAIDYLKAAPVVGRTVYSGASPTGRQEFEEDVRFAILYAMADSVGDHVIEGSVTGVFVGLVAVLTGFVVSVVVGWQAWRVGRLERELQMLRAR